MKQALAAGNLGAVARQMGNVFEEVLTAEESRADRDLQRMCAARGAAQCRHDRLRPTVFGLFAQKEQAERAAQTLRSRYAQLFLTTPVQRV